MPQQALSSCTIRLDSASLDDAAAFWRSTLGYQEVSRTADTTPMERRTLQSDSYPELAIELISCRPRPTIGSTLGSLRSLCFKVSDPVATARQALHALWTQPIDPTEPPPDTVMLIDPSGYRVELVRAS